MAAGVELPRWVVAAWNALSAVALAGFGVALAMGPLPALREGLRGGPEELPCARWLEERRTRWVSLSGCRLDLRAASARSWKRPALPDGGRAPFRTLQLAVPVVADEVYTWPPAVVLVTDDAQLKALVDTLAALPEAGVDAYIEAHRDELVAALVPPRVDGLTTDVPSFTERASLDAIGASGALVLRHHARPDVANALFALLVGAALAALGGWRMYALAARVTARPR